MGGCSLNVLQVVFQEWSHPPSKKASLVGTLGICCVRGKTLPTLSVGEERTKGNPGHHSLGFSTWAKQSRSLGKKRVQNA